MEAARERSSAPGTPSSTGGREGGGDISKLDGQSKNQNKEFHRSDGEDDYKDDMCRLLLGNSNTYLASKQQLHPPLVASRFKTYLQMQLFTCWKYSFKFTCFPQIEVTTT